MLSIARSWAPAGASGAGETEGPSSAPSPRPRPCLVFMGQYLLGQLKVGCRSGGPEVVEHDRLAMAWRLGDSYISRNDGLHDLPTQMTLDFGLYLGRQACAAIEHRQHHAFYFEGRIELFLHETDGTEDMR